MLLSGFYFLIPLFEAHFGFIQKPFLHFPSTSFSEICRLSKFPERVAFAGRPPVIFCFNLTRGEVTTAQLSAHLSHLKKETGVALVIPTACL